MVAGLRRLAALQEPVDLLRDQHQGAVLLLLRVRTRHGVSGRQDVVGVHSRLAVQPVPDDAGKIEEERLTEKDERNPLVIEDHLALFVWAWDFIFPGEIVGVPHPTVAVRVLLVAAGEVYGSPAGYGRADVGTKADQNGGDDQVDDGVTRRETISEVIIARVLHLRVAGDQPHELIHGRWSFVRRL